jgi:gliding motility-associated-like protein
MRVINVIKKSNSIDRIIRRFLCCSLKIFSITSCLIIHAQECPKNIDFETGTFENWTCYVGFLLEEGNKNIIRLSPTGQPAQNRQTMYASTLKDSLDPYGHFPVNCPNGSGHSVRLGNDEGGALAEGLSYEFTIPANKNLFTIIYNYAIVFQESPHLEHQQPRFEVEVTNITKNEIMTCSSFEFHPFGPLIPGFKIAPELVNNVPLWYKDWTTTSINLNGHAGETIRLFFKTADCTYFDHFGYAYIDVNTECNGEFMAAKYCAGDTSITLTAPAGYRNYNWYNATFSQSLGNTQTLSLPAETVAGIPIPVVVSPDYGYGCIDTFYAKAANTLTVKANAGPDKLSCNNDSASIGSAAISGLAYRWTPSQGLSDSAISSPLANPGLATRYVLTASSNGGGCIDRDTVYVAKSFINDSVEVIGKLNYCSGSGDSLTLRVQNAGEIQWFRDTLEIEGESHSEYKPDQSGIYFAQLSNGDGCNVLTQKKVVHIDSVKQGINYPIQIAVSDVPVNLNARDFGDIFLWSPGTFLTDPNIASPGFKGKTDQLYTIHIGTLSGCATVDTQMVKVVPHAEIYVPSAFTPNDDQINDILRPILFGIREFHYFKVFNRWGNLVFETNKAGTGWDGKEKATSASNQIVVWMAEGIGWDNKVYFRKGFCTILR